MYKSDVYNSRTKSSSRRRSAKVKPGEYEKVIDRWGEYPWKGGPKVEYRGKCEYNDSDPMCACDGCRDKLTLAPEIVTTYVEPGGVLGPDDTMKRSYVPASAEILVFNPVSKTWNLHPNVIIDTGAGIGVIKYTVAKRWGWNEVEGDSKSLSGVGGASQSIRG